MKNSRIAGLVALVALSSPFAVKAGVDNVRLDVVALDTGVDCDRIFFRSTQRFPNTIFVMPRVAVGTTKNGNDGFAIEPDDEGGYILSLSLYFPKGDELISEQPDDPTPSAGRCNYEAVQYVLSKDVKGTRDEVKRIARMPISSIEVTIPGVASKGLIGRTENSTDSVDVLNYQGVAYPAEMKLTSAEHKALLRRLNRGQGLPIKVKFLFNASSHSGTVDAELNASDVAKHFEAAAAGQVKIATVKAQGLLKDALKSQSVNVTIEGDNTDFAKIANDLIAKFIQETSTTATTPDGNGETGGAEMMEVKAVAKYLRSRSSIKIRAESYAKAALASAETVVNLVTRISDPRVREIEVVAKQPDITLDEALAANQTIRISAAYTRFMETEYKKRESYITKRQIKELGLVQHFPDLASGQMHVENEPINDELVGIGRWSVSAIGAPLQIYSSARYTWKRTERYPVRTWQQSERIEPTLEDLKRFPIFVTFSRLGRRMYHLTELVGEHDGLWTGEFDPQSGAIVIKTKAELGLVTIRESFKGEDVKFTTVTDEVVQQRRASWSGTPTEGQPVVLKKQERMPVRQRMVKLYVSRPEATNAAEPTSADTPAFAPAMAPAHAPAITPQYSGSTGKD